MILLHCGEACKTPQTAGEHPSADANKHLSYILKVSCVHSALLYCCVGAAELFCWMYYHSTLRWKENVLAWLYVKTGYSTVVVLCGARSNTYPARNIVRVELQEKIVQDICCFLKLAIFRGVGCQLGGCSLCFLWWERSAANGLYPQSTASRSDYISGKPRPSPCYLTCT